MHRNDIYIFFFTWNTLIINTGFPLHCYGLHVITNYYFDNYMFETKKPDAIRTVQASAVGRQFDRFKI